ncbi:hypothetical protein [Streptomyces griseocarneus]|uniref:hypothetical protein n=1 Tax=Streptomyces griseocarneus TaxID=51201 RepID=UPI00167D6F9C|nr:hypothetical protein [Streptomyces griseocarneus]MBZ6476976.1 hypothetical protein [Streptomyces griseocarneus]GHG76378.1 hypothetical protein GCM10018779_54650 [Streptomyces griseocarneus]
MTDTAKHTLRTVLQTAVALAIVLPAIVDAAGVPATLPWVAGALAAAGGLTRVMAVPGVQALLPAWLRTGRPAPPGSDAELVALARDDRGRP